jgi:hypothetical protein
MVAGFETWTGIGEDAKIRTYSDQFKELDQWSEDWAAHFSRKEPDIPAIRRTYAKLMGVFSEQFGFVQE